MKKQLSAYLDGELDPQTNAAVERHLVECPDCRQLLQEWSGMDDLLELDRCEISDPYLLTRVRAQVRRKTERTAAIVRWLRRSFAPALTAAGLLIGFLIGNGLSESLVAPTIDPSAAVDETGLWSDAQSLFNRYAEVFEQEPGTGEQDD
ncbi:hypothetical protein GX408_02755 [bacterium]|nr:hypothetical protein [bacterium]